jgi:hypothetical protein
VQEGAFREFSRPSRPGAGLEASRPNSCGHQNAAVAADFDHVLTCITGGGAMNHNQNLIYCAVTFDDFTKLLQMGRDFREFLFPAKNFVCDCDGLWS